MSMLQDVQTHISLTFCPPHICHEPDVICHMKAIIRDSLYEHIRRIAIDDNAPAVRMCNSCLDKMEITTTTHTRLKSPIDYRMFECKVTPNCPVWERLTCEASKLLECGELNSECRIDPYKWNLTELAQMFPTLDFSTVCEPVPLDASSTAVHHAYAGGRKLYRRIGQLKLMWHGDEGEEFSP